MEIKKTFDFYDQTYLRSYNLNESIKYQLNLLDSLDAFTRKHSENVATITCNLCRKLHLPKGFTEYCVTCAYIHDIGKMFVPQAILQKPGALTDEEYEIIKSHTVLGYKLCIKDAKLRPFHAGPYYHHEALNGSGYPQGLTDKEIPLEAKIIRVADEYDALVSKRQYKSHIGIIDAFQILIDNTKPSNALQTIINNTKPSDNSKAKGSKKVGKNSKLIVRKLKEVIVDDIEYEIACTMNYIDTLQKELKRCKKIQKEIDKMNALKKEEDINGYKEYINMILNKGETIENFSNVYEDIQKSFDKQHLILKDLHDEIVKVKKLKV